MTTTQQADAARRDAIINSAVEQVRALLEDKFAEINAAGVAAFGGDEQQDEPVAKCRIALAWSALSTAPTVTARCGWSVSYQAESEESLDPLQEKLPIT